MKLSTRLLATLLPGVALVMLLYAIWAVQQREETLVRVVEGESRAYADAAALAFEHALADAEPEAVQEALDRLGREPRIYGVFLYGPDGTARFASGGPPPGRAMASAELEPAIASGRPVELRRRIGDQEVHSVVRPLRDAEGRVVGVLEVAQPLSFVEEEKTSTTLRFLFNTLTLLVLVSALVLWLVRRFISRPLDRFVAATRRLRWEDLSYRVPEDPSGTELALLASEFNDMAERLEAARAALVRETEERLGLEGRVREAEKLAAVGTLAAGVAHQIAAPLNVIGGRTEMLLRRGLSDPDGERHLRIIHSEIDRITAVVRSLLDLARQPDVQVRTMDIARVVRRAARGLQREMREAEIALAVEADASEWVEGDADLLQEVVIILLTNAMQALRETQGRRVVRIRVAGAREGEVEVSVADTGPGIPPEDLPRVFDPFFTTKPGGTGLGLAIARSLVERLGGRLTAESGQGGAVFRFTLRAAERPAAVAAGEAP